jgi:hypothetical protein
MGADYFIIYFGILLLAAGLHFVIRDWVHSRYGYHTQGKVVELLGKWVTSGGKIRYCYYPIIQFTTPEQETKEMIMEVGSTIALYSEGEPVEIVYYKGNIYPNATGWKVFYGLLTLTGLSILLYQMIK